MRLRALTLEIVVTSTVSMVFDQRPYEYHQVHVPKLEKTDLH